MTNEERLRRVNKEFDAARNYDSKRKNAALGGIWLTVPRGQDVRTARMALYFDDTDSRRSGTKRAVLIDDEGRECALLEAFGPGLRAPGRLLDENGKLRLELVLTKSGASLVPHHEIGLTGAQLTVAQNRPVVSLCDKKGQPRAMFIAFVDAPFFALCDKKGEIGAGLTVLNDGRWLGVSEEDGKYRTSHTRLKEPLTIFFPRFLPALSLLDENEQVRVVLSMVVQNDPPFARRRMPGLCLLGENGEVRVVLVLFERRGGAFPIDTLGSPFGASAKTWPLLGLPNKKGKVQWVSYGAPWDKRPSVGGRG